MLGSGKAETAKATEAAAAPRTDRPSQLKAFLPLLGAGVAGGCIAAVLLLAIMPRSSERPAAGNIDPTTLETRLGEVADRLAAGQAATETLTSRIAAL